MEKICLFCSCSKIFDGKFCSKFCENAWNKQQSFAGSGFCKQCEKQFDSRYYNAKRKLFCSADCKRDWHKNIKKENNAKIFNDKDRSRICDYCKKEFEIKRGRNMVDQKFCSRPCHANWHKQKLREKIAEERENTIRTCPICKNTFTPKVTLRQIYCSKKCCYLMPKKAYSMLAKCLNKVGTTKDAQSHELLKYSPRQLQDHIINHPNWKNINQKQWHLDHIFPVIAFVEHNILDMSIICCLSNLQPLESNSNLRKSKKYNKEQFLLWLKDTHNIDMTKK